MSLSKLYEFCQEMSEMHPDKKEQIMGFYDLAKMEVEDGESEENECELAMSDIEELCS